jgi:hypothetical protein
MGENEEDMNSIIRRTYLKAKIRVHDLSKQNQEC